MQLNNLIKKKIRLFLIIFINIISLCLSNFLKENFFNFINKY